MEVCRSSPVSQCAGSGSTQAACHEVEPWAHPNTSHELSGGCDGETSSARVFAICDLQFFSDISNLVVRGRRSTPAHKEICVFGEVNAKAVAL